MAYKLTNGQIILRLDDGILIPIDLKNGDYMEYLKWVALGNIAVPADPVIVLDPSDINVSSSKLEKAICIYFGSLSGKTPAQVIAGIKAAYQALP